jgi:hypothetical protein
MNRGPQEATLKRIRAEDWDGSVRRRLRPVSKRSWLKSASKIGSRTRFNAPGTTRIPDRWNRKLAHLAATFRYLQPFLPRLPTRAGSRWSGSEDTRCPG